MARTSAHVNIFASNNATLQDAFQFGTVGDTSWDLVGQHFIMEIKASRDDDDPLFTLTSDASEIIIDDTAQRVIHLNVTDDALKAALPVNDYVYDLIMYDESTPPIRVQLMHGKFVLGQGVTEN